MKPTIAYRNLVPTDHEILFKMWKTAPGLTIRNADSFEGFTAFLKRNPRLSFGVESGGRLVGSILGGHDGRFGSIHHLVVMPAFQNQGLGKQLVKLCLDQLESTGTEKCHIFINRDNQNGIKFWENIDWVERTDLFMASFTFDP